MIYTFKNSCCFKIHISDFTDENENCLYKKLLPSKPRNLDKTLDIITYDDEAISPQKSGEIKH